MTTSPPTTYDDLKNKGHDVGEISDPFYNPRGEFHAHDPDGDAIRPCIAAALPRSASMVPAQALPPSVLYQIRLNCFLTQRHGDTENCRSFLCVSVSLCEAS